jgi:hypothetical protein
MVSKKEETVDDLQVPVTLERFINKIPQRFKDGEFGEDREEYVENEWTQFKKGERKQRAIGKKFTLYATAIAASLALFIVSGFISPAMAKMLGKIPPLSSLYERYDEDPYKLIKQELKKQGYPVKEMTEFGGGKGGYYIFLNASDDDVSNMKKGIEKTAFSILHSKKYKGTAIEDYFVRVRKYKAPSEKVEKENEQLIKEDQEIMAIIEPVLKAHHYNNSLGCGRGTVELEFPTIESQEKMDEILNAVKEALQAAGKGSTAIKVRKFNLAKQQQYTRWSDAITGIAAEFKYYKKYQVSSVGYQSKDGIMRVLIKMKLSSKDENAKSQAAKLNKMIEDFIHTDEIWNKVKDDPYVVIISSKDGKSLN